MMSHILNTFLRGFITYFKPLLLLVKHFSWMTRESLSSRKFYLLHVKHRNYNRSVVIIQHICIYVVSISQHLDKVRMADSCFIEIHIFYFVGIFYAIN